MTFGERLKRLRKQKGLTQQQVADVLNIQKATYSGYETGRREPDVPKIKTLAKLFGVSGDEILGSEFASKEPALTPPELDHIKKYRTLDGHGKRTVDVVLEEEVQRMEEMRKAEEKKVLKPKAAVIDLRRYWESPSAGNGNDLTDGGYDIIQVPDTLTARLASYALTVSGDSMEPDLMDGDTVLVKAQETYEVGDIVVFSKNGDSYIKYAGEHCFESANPDYPDIVIGEDDSVRCFGVVLGKL